MVAPAEASDAAMTAAQKVRALILAAACDGGYQGPEHIDEALRLLAAGSAGRDTRTAVEALKKLERAGIGAREDVRTAPEESLAELAERSPAGGDDGERITALALARLVGSSAPPTAERLGRQLAQLARERDYLSTEGIAQVIEEITGLRELLSVLDEILDILEDMLRTSSRGIALSRRGGRGQLERVVRRGRKALAELLPPGHGRPLSRRQGEPCRSNALGRAQHN